MRFFFVFSSLVLESVILPSLHHFFIYIMLALANVHSDVLITRFTGAEQEPHELHARMATARGESEVNSIV
jgi:hypothetical protein